MTHIRYKNLYTCDEQVCDIQAACSYSNPCGEHEGVAEMANSVGRNAEALVGRLLEQLTLKGIFGVEELSYILRLEVTKIITVDDA